MSARPPFLEALTKRRSLEVITLSLVILAMLSTGAVFLPIASGADEAAHYIYSSAVVRGQAGLLEPTIPARIANTHYFAACIAFQPDVTAACQGPLRITTTADVTSQTNAGLYNPVFYFWVGLGTLVVPTEYGMYLSRLLSAVVTAGFLGWGLSLLRRGSASVWPLVGAALILTPMTLYVGMVVNPSAWEIATLFAASVAASQLLSGPESGRGWTEQHSLLAMAGSLLVVTRGLSPVLFVLTAVAIVTANGWGRSMRHLRSPSSRLVLIVLVVAAAFSASWVATHGTHYVGVERPATFADGLEGISIFFSAYYEQLNQMYGDLGWLDLPSPHILSLVWLLLVGCFVIVSLAVASRRGRLAIMLAFASTTLLPGILAGLQWSGVGWQGRYSLPLVAALFVVSGFTSDRRLAREPRDSAGRRVIVALRNISAAFFIVGLGAMTFQVAHRYTVGVSQPWLAEPSWEPPAALWLLGGLYCIGALTLAAYFLKARAGSSVTLDGDASLGTESPGHRMIPRK